MLGVQFTPGIPLFSFFMPEQRLDELGILNPLYLIGGKIKKLGESLKGWDTEHPAKISYKKRIFHYNRRHSYSA